MEYAEWLEHAETFFRAMDREREKTARSWMAQTGRELPPELRRSGWLEVLASELANERKRGELAVQLAGERP